jgi:calnexin
VHLILRHKSPKTGKIEEKHLTGPPLVETDKKTHVYTAVLRASNNSYAVLIDGEVKKEGSLFEDFDPPINPPETIPDPEDKKPEDWVDEAKIPDPDAKKPDDWDEDAPRTIPDEDAVKPEGWLDDEPAEVDDPEAQKPEDWDDEEDGDWEPPKVANPKCKDASGCGEWQRPTKAVSPLGRMPRANSAGCASGPCCLQGPGG